MKPRANGATNSCAYESFFLVSILIVSVSRNNTDHEVVASHELSKGHVPGVISKVPGKHI